MRPSASCCSCMFLVAGHFGEVSAIISDNKCKPGGPGKLGYERTSPWYRLLPQNKLGTKRPVDHQSCPESMEEERCPKVKVYGTTACAATLETVVVVSHPKITEAPSAPLLKRKLGSNKWDMIHDGIQGQKRDATDCGAGYQLCPASLNGGCCPNDRDCATNSCYARSAAPASACGVAGYIPCGIAEGGGCCPTSYACQVGGCSPSAGVINTETCGINSFLCPASVGYGCCANGFACGVSACYATSVTTFVLTETLTTTDAQNLPHTVTSIITTASTPTLPTNVASNTAPAGIIAKVTPTAAAIPKTSPTSSSSSSSGLTKGELGGIIGGAIALLAVLITVTIFIIRRLNKVAKATTASQSRTRTSSSGQHSQPPRHSRPQDTMSIDPLMMTPSEASRSVHAFPSHPSATHSSAHEVDASSPSPPVFGSPFSPRSPPGFSHYPRGYNAVPTSDSNSSSGYGRNPSVDYTPSLGQNSNAGYFDIPPKQDLRDQNLRFGHSPTSSPSRRPSQHQRNWSNASNQSEVSQGSSSLAELDAGVDGDRRSSVQKVLHGFSMGRLSIRRKSSQTNPSPTTLTGGPTSRHPEWGPGANPGTVGLGHIPEAGESRVRIHEAGDAEMVQIPLVDEYQGMMGNRFGR